MTGSIRYGALLLAAALLPAAAAQAQRALPPEDALHYSIRSRSPVFQLADSTSPYLTLGLQEPVQVLENGGGWARIRTRDGAQGLVRAEDLSNVWIRISKSHQSVLVYRGTELVERIPADLGYNFFADKERRGSPGDPDHWRTPDGVFHVVEKNERSQYHRALVLNYPNEEDARRGLRDSIITEAQYWAILQANQSFERPPMSTALGGWIEIHGRGTGQRANWTQGCVAIPDDAIDRIWPLVHVGTPVLIDPE
jgi:hypothetical protein